MRVSEEEFVIPIAPGHRNLLSHIEQAMRFRLADAGTPLRFVVTETDAEHYHCEIGVMANDAPHERDSIFRFVRRDSENIESYNAVMLVPTGISAEIGGHAGDATPFARLLGTACDRLIIHPNVVNASDLNEMPENALYVEGSVISRLMMGTVGLSPVRANRVLVVIDKHKDHYHNDSHQDDDHENEDDHHDHDKHHKHGKHHGHLWPWRRHGILCSQSGHSGLHPRARP